MVTQIERMLVEAWEKFCAYYDTEATKYTQIEYNRLCNECNYKEEKAKKELEKNHWICWDEYDLTFHIGRFFYDILSKKKEEEFSNIEIHFDKKVDRKNFKGYTFEDKLDELKKRLIREGVLKKRAPKVDMIVAKEDSNASLLLCAEAKCFRYATDWEKAINDDIKKLRAYRDQDSRIAKRVVFMLFDDYYWCNDVNTANEIQQRLNGIRNENGITVLFHTSEAKLENY